MSLYDPISTKISLEPGETNAYSFFVVEYQKEFLSGYQQLNFTRYICHITNKRLILEPYQVDTTERLLVKTALHLTSLASLGLSFTMNTRTKESIRRSEESKIFSIFHHNISAISLIKPNKIAISGKCLVKIEFNNILYLDNSEVVFGITSIPKNSIERYLGFGTKVLHKEFVECINRLANLK